MSREYTVLVTLVVYKLILIGIGLWANRKTQTSSDFFIGGKQLGSWVAAVSSSASASSAWSLLGVSGAAFVMGLSAIWLIPAVVGGYIFNWLWLAPRIRQLGLRDNAVTLTDLLAGNGIWSYRIKWLASIAIIFSFAFYIAAQFQGAGATFSNSFDLSSDSAIVLGAGIIVIYTLLGGFWAVSLTDTLQGLLMALAALIVPWAALVAVGGFTQLIEGMQQQFSAEQLSLTANHSGLVGVAFIVGMLGIGLGNPGNPMWLTALWQSLTERSLRQAKLIGIAWPSIVYMGMLLLGWSAKVLMPQAAQPEQILFAMTELLFNPIVAGVIIAAVLSAIMSTADSQLLVSASAFAHDIYRGSKRNQLLISRITLLVMSAIAVTLALFAPEAIFSRVLFAWSALGSAFGPLLITVLMGWRSKAFLKFSSIACGFVLTVVFNGMSNTPGDVVERVIPFVLAFVIAALGRPQEVVMKDLVNGWSEAVFVVQDIRQKVDFYCQFLGWELIQEIASDNSWRSLWQLPEHAVLEHCLVAEPNSTRGMIRLVEIHGVEQTHVRANSQIWDTGGIFDVNSRVQNSFQLSELLNKHQWYGANTPVPMTFGGFSVYEWLVKGHDGIVFALIERLTPALDKAAQPQALIGRIFNASMVVKDYQAEVDFFQQILGFEVKVKQHQCMPSAGSNVFAMPHNWANKTPHHLTMLGAEGETEGTVEIVAFPELQGNDYSERHLAHNLGISCLRFPVTHLTRLVKQLNKHKITISESTLCHLAPYGTCDVISVTTPNNNRLEFFQLL